MQPVTMRRRAQRQAQENPAPTTGGTMRPVTVRRRAQRQAPENPAPTTGGTMRPVPMRRRAQRHAQQSRTPTPREGQPSRSNRRTGGILKPDGKYTSHRVNIRPSTWVDDFKPSQFWIGRLPSFERAQLVADAVYFYVGDPPFHFKDVVNLYPPITCIGRVSGTPEELSTQEMFRSYILAIAKGEVYEPQRKDFIDQVKGVIEMDTFPFPAPPEDVDVEHDEGEEDTPPMENDKNAAMAIRMSSDELRIPGSDPAHVVRVPGFELQHTEQVESHVCPTSQFIGSMPSIDDFPTFQDEDGDKVWKEWMNDLIAQSAATPSVVSDHGEGPPPRTVRSCF